jgi:hypothetical protein
MPRSWSSPWGKRKWAMLQDEAFNPDDFFFDFDEDIKQIIACIKRYGSIEIHEINFVRGDHDGD